MEHIRFDYVDIKDGIFGKYQKLNEETTIYAVMNRFKESGRIKAFSFDWKDGEPLKPHVFWDSDVAKWMEAVAYILKKKPNKELEAEVEKLIDNIEKNQWDDGYFNIYYTVCEPGMRFTNRDKHELYCAGHLIEAAVAYYEATGKDRFLKCMCKYVDLIEKIFIKENSASFLTPGHEEIELALVKLYKCTGNEKYLNIAKFFIDMRGNNDKDTQRCEPATERYDQTHLPVREMETAEGHAVRGNYLYTAMADVARETKDDKLKEACRKIFDNIYYKKMYITGGTGSTRCGEAYTVDYHLPGKYAYSETCASVSLVYFAHRMLTLYKDSKYADVIEKAIYNSLTSGISLDGSRFFYSNPLEVDPVDLVKDVAVKQGFKERFPINQRVEQFNCSCCPPNLNRFFASVGDYIFSVEDETLFVHQFVPCLLDYKGIKAEIKTNYPDNGKVVINFEGALEIAVRIPGWCKNFKINSEYILKNGYAYIKAQKEVEIEFEIKPTLKVANPNVRYCGGKVALMNGPTVYCIEAVDNGENISSVAVDKNLICEMVFDKELDVNTIIADGFRFKEQDSLYNDFDGELIKTKIKFIPYRLFANRGESEMLVWCNIY